MDLGAGENVRVKLVPTYQFSLHDESLENCDWTSYGNWALASGFDEDAYTTAVAGLKALPPAEYWATVHDQAAMTAYFNSTQLGTLDRYFNYTNAKRDRCAGLMCPHADVLSCSWLRAPGLLANKLVRHGVSWIFHLGCGRWTKQ
jgi:hypothetical protein